MLLLTLQGGQPQFKLVDAVPEYLKLGLVSQATLG